MDPLEQIYQFHTEVREQHATQITKLTLGLSLAEWLLERSRSEIEAPGDPDVRMLKLFGIPIVIDSEFRAGQLRIHCGTQFEDRFVIVPPTYPRMELMATYEAIERQQQLWRLDTYAYVATYRAHGAPAPWQPLGLIQGLTIEPTGT